MSGPAGRRRSVPADGPAYAAALAAELDGHWPGLAARVSAADGDGRTLEPDDLGRPEALADCLARFARAHPDTDERALASLWIQWYAATTWPALAAGAVVLGVGPPPDQAAIVLDEEARPVGVRVRAVEPVEPGMFLEALARRQAGPLMAAAAATGLSPRVPWSNAINVLGWMLDHLRAVAGEARLAPAFDVLARPRWGDGTPNPLAGGGACGGGRPARRVCCLRYRLQGFDYCGDCPIPPARRG